MSWLMNRGDLWEMVLNGVNLPPKLTGVMRKMALACEHFHRTARGGLLVEDVSSSEDDDAESDDGSKSD